MISICRILRQFHWWSFRPLYAAVLGIRRLLGEERLRSEAADMLGLSPQSRVLDLGCGIGLNYPHLAPRVAEVIGVDERPDPLEGARALTREWGWTNVRSIREDLRKLPFDTGSFDAVLCTFRLTATRAYRRVLEEAVRVLRPGGVLVVVDFSPLQGVWFTLAWLVRPLLAVLGSDPDRPVTEDMDRLIPLVAHRVRLRGLVFLAAGRKPGQEEEEKPVEQEPSTADLVPA